MIISGRCLTNPANLARDDGQRVVLYVSNLAVPKNSLDAATFNQSRLFSFSAYFECFVVVSLVRDISVIFVQSRRYHRHYDIATLLS